MTQESLERLIDDALDVLSSETYVSMPGIVQSYDAALAEADVEPAFLRRYAGQENVSKLPLLHRVPVVMPRCASGRVHLPLAKGDTVLLVFADRSMENWLRGKGEPREPQRVRKHDYMDPVAIPGFHLPLASGSKPPTYPNALSVEVSPGTKVAVTNGSVELLNLLNDFMDIFSRTTTGLLALYALHVHPDPVSGNSGPPDNAAAFSPAGFTSEVTALLAKLDALKP